MIYTQVYSMYMVAGMESDEDVRRVPEFGLELAGPSSSERGPGSAVGPDQARVGQRRRGRSPADKEHKRLKRLLLRNRVSAQQARERKKAYLNDLEAKVKDLEAKNSELEERMSTLQNENTMLRQSPAILSTASVFRVAHNLCRLWHRLHRRFLPSTLFFSPDGFSSKSDVFPLLPLRLPFGRNLARRSRVLGRPSGDSRSTIILSSSGGEAPTDSRATEPADASGSITRALVEKGKESVKVEEAPGRGYTIWDLCKVEDWTGVERYFASIMTRLKTVEGEDPLMPRWSFIFRLTQMGRISYEFGFWVALERLWGKYPEVEIEQDPFVECPEDANVGMDLNQPFDDNTPSKK
ncbi:hypothetical protein B296_00039559 [Ensete ventricosum]|uniref:Transcription factor HY5 n=1 Tax=Ensete ventricosum TaxID=4639 RepID=A0A426ZSX0_ENSVE|nr:hypothetical protein B296_00039559 [Ensete ventricosum]